MEKVYFDPAFYGSWFVNDLSDLYKFKYIDTEANEEKSVILNWTKNTEHEESLKTELGIKTDLRVYSADVDGLTFEFVVRYDSGKFILNILSLPIYKYNFVGETI